MDLLAEHRDVELLLCRVSVEVCFSSAERVWARLCNYRAGVDRQTLKLALDVSSDLGSKSSGFAS